MGLSIKDGSWGMEMDGGDCRVCDVLGIAEK